MEVVHRIHLHPPVGNAEVTQQLSCNSRWITEQWVKVRCGVKGKAFAPESAAITTDHVMLLDQQYSQSFTRQQACADQSPNAGPDYHDIVRPLRRLASQPCEKAFHDAFNFGLLRPYVSCAATNSPLAMAAPIESSPARSAAQMISANLPAWPVPAQPKISRHSRLVPRAVPPPTVATVSEGNVTLA